MTPLLLLFVITLLQACCEAKWPNAPYIDVCSGATQTSCAKTAGCSWFQTNAPWCYDTLYQQQYAPKGYYEESDFVKKFFTFSFGTHLSEGSTTQIHYNLNVTECAAACLGSASTKGATYTTRCLSFDFYPFEDPWYQPPYNEVLENGMCVLNTANRNTARLRNEDQGFTDAELFYKYSHYTSRPFSNLGGYYEIRDPRGGQVSEMLDYGGSSLDVTTQIVWGGSRWGITHLRIPPPIDTSYACQGPNALDAAAGDGSGPPPQFYGGYTPVDTDQRCPGMVKYGDAAALCNSTGGFLCATQAEVLKLDGSKLGCSLDGFPMWAAADVPTSPSQTKFVRCCATYSAVTDCTLYTQTNIDFCKGLTTFNDCVSKGSGTARQNKLGFGNMLVQVRAACKSGAGRCKGVVQDWKARDQCVWCLKPGVGAGECRPGNDYGICATADVKLQALFSLTMKASCGPPSICRLSYRYPDLGLILDVPTMAPTKLPTHAPTSPSFPTLAPTPVPFACGSVNSKAVAARKKACLKHSDVCVYVNKKCKKKSG